MDLVTLFDTFDTDEQCRAYLEMLRWPDGVVCPRCGVMNESSRIKNRAQWHCRACDHHFSVTAGTIMHDSHLPLRKWFAAIFLMVESRKGMSANQLKRTLGIAYKTAWHLCHRIREAMGNDPLEGSPTLLGVVEVDETLIGGRVRGQPALSNKTWVAGAIQRGGQLRVERIPNVKRDTLHDFIRRSVKDEAEAIYTDELKSYLGIEDDNTRHETVNHSEEEWVVGDVHTNGIEGVWSLFKRSIIGAFRQMSAKHMDRYLEELEWRFNNCNNPHIFRDTMARIVKTDPLTFDTLIGKEAA